MSTASRWPQVHLQAPVYGSSGYAAAAREFALALKQQGAQITLEPLSWISGFDIQETRERFLQLKALESPAAQDLLLHWTIASEFTGRQGFQRAVGHCIFETDRLIQPFVAGCNRMDAVIVPSEFHAQAFARSGVTVPLQVIPEGVDCERFCPTGPTLRTLPKRFSFLVIAQLSYRKGLDLALRAFLELFAEHDDVQLLLRCYLKDNSAKDREQVRQFVQVFREQEMQGLQKGHIYLLDKVADLHLPALYRSVQVLLAPFRGEGWGLPMIEALASEVPVIATGWGGPLSYLNPQLASLLGYQLKPIPANMPASFLGAHLIQAREEGHLLAEPDLEQLKYAMWEAYENYFLAKTRAGRARQHLKQHFSWQQAAQQFLEWTALCNND